MKPVFPSWEDHIDNVMDWFDFEKVHETMKLLNWTWGMGQNAHVPEVPEIRKCVRDGLRRMISNGHRRWESAGFVAEKVNNEFLAISFQVTSWETDHMLEEEDE